MPAEPRRTPRRHPSALIAGLIGFAVTGLLQWAGEDVAAGKAAASRHATIFIER